MVLLDLDGGSIGAATYSSQEPLERRLASFEVDISGNPSIAELFGQLRGARVTVRSTDGEITGTILGTEHRKLPESAGDGQQIHTMNVNLVTSGGIRSIPVHDIRWFDFEDPDLAEELSLALTALAEHRADSVKTVDLNFTGAPGAGRRVVVGYVHEMPVWKTSYRLVLPDPASGGEPTLQGWAIVENTTDHDWEDVSLSLASGRPVSFTMDLYEPLFAPRPDVPVPFLAAVAPKLYESALNRQDFADDAARGARRVLGRFGAGLASEAEVAGAPASAGAPISLRDVPMGDYLADAQASAGVVGEQFFYTLDQPVTLERRRSAMLPILSAPIEGRRVSIFNQASTPRNPMRGVELSNDSGLTLMPGPIAVYDTGAYAGDAQIPHTSRGMDRLLSYAVDLDVVVDVETARDDDIRSISIVNGVVRHSVERERTTRYTLTNNDAAKARTVLVEQPRLDGWTLVAPGSPREETENLYRFEVALGAGGGETLEVVERSTVEQVHGLTDYSGEWIALYLREKKMSPAVADAIRTASQLQGEAKRLERRVEDLTRQRGEIGGDQERLRRNMQTIDRNSDLYARYLRKLAEQEDQVEAIDGQLATARGDLERKRDELRRFIAGLNVR
jgi:hypothetical protein